MFQKFKTLIIILGFCGYSQLLCNMLRCNQYVLHQIWKWQVCKPNHIKIVTFGLGCHSNSGIKMVFCQKLWKACCTSATVKIWLDEGTDLSTPPTPMKRFLFKFTLISRMVLKVGKTLKSEKTLKILIPEIVRHFSVSMHFDLLVVYSQQYPPHSQSLNYGIKYMHTFKMVKKCRLK